MTCNSNYFYINLYQFFRLNATQLIGTNALKASLHGYFMEMRAYQKLMSANDPFAYDKYRKEQINKKINEMRDKRINIPSRKP